MGYESNTEKAEGVGYDRLMAKMVSDRKVASDSPVELRTVNKSPEVSEERTQFGRRSLGKLSQD